MMKKNIIKFDVKKEFTSIGFIMYTVIFLASCIEKISG